MTLAKNFLFTAALTQAVFSSSAGATVIIASTNFDERTLGETNVANDTAIGASLNWVTNGVADPGSMNALAGGSSDKRCSIPPHSHKTCLRPH